MRSSRPEIQNSVPQVWKLVRSAEREHAAPQRTPIQLSPLQLPEVYSYTLPFDSCLRDSAHSERSLPPLDAERSLNGVRVEGDSPLVNGDRIRLGDTEILFETTEHNTDRFLAVGDTPANATISIPLADSITTWRMAMVASTPHGALGTGDSRHCTMSPNGDSDIAR